MNVSFRYGHVNDLANIGGMEARITALENALTQALADLQHFKADVDCGLMPYPETIQKAIDRIDSTRA